MLRIEALLGNNDVMAISEALRKIEIGGLTVTKVRGRGKHPPAQLHAAKGSAIFQPQFSEKYLIVVIIPENKEDEVINIIKTKGTVGKIFVSPILRAVDIASGIEGEETI
ncbi:MAG: P-II family nitrogen regulator [Nitrosarchaeum sp.]|nr:P-II family nitrogen regulator [Nitrosarchaeum sp.]